MHHILIRMGIIVGTLVGVQVGLWYVGLTAHPTMVEPQKPIAAFPMTVSLPESGTWDGRDQELEKREFNATQAAAVVSRVYTKQNRNIRFLLAQYTSPRDGLYHNPMNCYRTAGFHCDDHTKLPLEVAHRPDSQIDLSTWSRKDERIVVAYWYEVGDRTAFGREDLLGLQWAMRGKPKWPMMFKVLLEVPADESGQARAELLEMAKSVRQWLGEVQPVMN